MIYLKDEATGVTVSGARNDVRIKLDFVSDDAWSPEQADALLRGLLRWKLETMGQEKTSELVHATIRDWMHHGVVRGGQ